MKAQAHVEFSASPAWHRSGDACFPTAARVGSDWWVLRVNSFPDHPLWTLFINGESRFDVDDPPASWGHPASDALPALSESDAAAALRGLKGLTAYGSEVGRPCDNLFCCG